MRELNGTRIRGNNPSHYNQTPNAILPDDLANHLLKYYGHVAIGDKYAIFDNKVLEYDSIKQLSFPGNNFDLSLAEMGLKHTSFYGRIMNYLKDNIYIPSDFLKESTSKIEISKKMHDVSKTIKQKLETLIKMREENKDLTVFNALENANEQLLKEFGALLFCYEKLLNNAQKLSNLSVNNKDNCNCDQTLKPSESTTTDNSIIEEIANLKSSKLDIVEANNKFALKESIPDISNLVNKEEIKDKLDKTEADEKYISKESVDQLFVTKESINTIETTLDEKISKVEADDLYTKKESLNKYATEDFVKDQVNKAQISGESQNIDLTPYALKTDIENSISDTKDELNLLLNVKIDKTVVESDYVKKVDLPDVTNFVTEEKVDEKISTIVIPSIDGLAKTEEVVSKIDYENDKSTFALSSNVVSNETYIVDKDTFALKSSLEELTTKYNDLLARIEKLENPSLEN